MTAASPLPSPHSASPRCRRARARGSVSVGLPVVHLLHRCPPRQAWIAAPRAFFDFATGPLRDDEFHAGRWTISF